MRRDRRALTPLAVFLLPTFLSACIRFASPIQYPSHSEDYSPPQWSAQKVAAVVEYQYLINSQSIPGPWADHEKDTMLASLRDARLFTSVDTLAPSDPNQPYLHVAIVEDWTPKTWSCPFFGCEPLENALNWFTILPVIFPMYSGEYDAKITVTAWNWDGNEKVYKAEGKTLNRNNALSRLFAPWGTTPFSDRMRDSIFNQMKRDGELYTLAPGADKPAIMARMRAREAERQRQEQERKLAEERAKQEAERQRIAAERQRVAEEQQRLAEAQREAERQRQIGAAAALPPIQTKPAPLVSQLDVDALPAMTTKADPHRHAVVVGIEQYRGKLPAADYAANDARVMAGYLTAMLGYPEENVVLLLNDKAARTDLEKYFEAWLPNRVEKGDSVFVYFSGHGAPNPKTGKAFIVPYDGDPSFMDQTGYPLDRLYDRLAKLPAKEIVVVLDSCFSGGGSRSVIAKGMRPMRLVMENPVLAGGSTAVLAASSGEQTSSTYDQYRHGLLTYYLLRGLRGEADRDQNGAVDLTELFDYLKPQVERTARREYNNEQTPQLLGSPQMLSKGFKLIDRAKP